MSKMVKYNYGVVKSDEDYSKRRLVMVRKMDSNSIYSRRNDAKKWLVSDALRSDAVFSRYNFMGLCWLLMA